MRVLVVDGHLTPDHRSVTAVTTALRGRGHDVDLLRLAEAGFDEFMSADERAAYHEDDNLVSEPQRDSARRVREADGLVVCTPTTAGTIEPRVKGWFERVFVPGVSFRFTRSGRITGALRNLVRIGMVVDSEDGPEVHARAGSTRGVIRAVRLNASRRCRTTYVALDQTANVDDEIAQRFGRW